MTARTITSEKEDPRIQSTGSKSLKQFILEQKRELKSKKECDKDSIVDNLDKKMESTYAIHVSASLTVQKQCASQEFEL